MKREILFRGKRTDNGEWVYGSAMVWNGCAQIIKHRIMINTLWAVDKFRVIPETVCQYTGLNDKNGVKIFEGDIVKGISNNPFSMGEWREYVVIWGVDHWHIKDTYFTLQELFNYCNNKIEVIGNIHDNPELTNN